MNLNKIETLLNSSDIENHQLAINLITAQLNKNNILSTLCMIAASKNKIFSKTSDGNLQSSEENIMKLNDKIQELFEESQSIIKSTVPSLFRIAVTKPSTSNDELTRVAKYYHQYIDHLVQTIHSINNERIN